MILDISSGRVEALSQLTTVLSLGATLLSFDFAGSGQCLKSELY
jgi:hypothetical protein